MGRVPLAARSSQAQFLARFIEPAVALSKVSGQGGPGACPVSSSDLCPPPSTSGRREAAQSLNEWDWAVRDCGILGGMQHLGVTSDGAREVLLVMGG